MLIGIGQCNRNLERFDDALQSYQLFLKEMPDYASRPEIPDVEGAIKDLNLLIAQGLILIKTDQDPVEVFLDNLPRGQSPLTIKGISPGEHQLSLSKSGYATYHQNITLSPGQRQELLLSLSVLPGSLEVSSSQEGAEVSLDGRVVGSVPLRLENISPGAHQVSLYKKGFRRHQEPIEVHPGESIRVSASLEVATGTINIKSNVALASITFDGKTIGQASPSGVFVLNDVPVGEHNVVIARPPFSSIRQELLLSEDTPYELSSADNAKLRCLRPLRVTVIVRFDLPRHLST